MFVEETLEILRGVPISCWLFLPLAFLNLGLGPAPAAALHEFTAHRMQHFDLHGVRYGRDPQAKSLFLNGAHHLCRFSQCSGEHGSKGGRGEHAEQKVCGGAMEGSLF